MKKVKNSEIAKIFWDIADLLDVKGENPFRVRAYHKAALLIESLPEPLYTIAKSEDRDLTDLQGIGKDLAGKIGELLDTGSLRYFEELKEEIPITLTDLMKLEGLGPRKVAAVFRELGVETVDQLEEAIKAGALEGLDGFGLKTSEKILRSIKSYRRRLGRYKFSVAEEYVDDLLVYLNEVSDVVDVAPTGSYRRRTETIGDIDILVAADKPSPVMEYFIEYDSVEEVIAKGSTKSAVRLRNGLQVDLRLLAPESFGAGLQYFTGSQAHNVALRTLAKKKGYKVNEYGVFKGDEKVAGESEEEVYTALGLTFIPPELREDRGEIEAALGNGLPDLIEPGDIRGDLQMHTTASDGRDSIREMALKAKSLGYEYIAITDHSKSETQAGGLSEKEVLDHIEAIDMVDAEIKGIRVLKGMEVDILKDGKLDYRDEILSRLDVVVAAVHSRFGFPREEQTRRIVKAIENSNVHILAHPTGRLIQQRDPYDVDMKKLMVVAREQGVALELNAFPDRLDLKDEHCRMAKEMGVRVVISSDAHNINQLEVMRYGVSTARRGWLEKVDVLNTMPVKDFLRELRG
jgi:DNA polymerase (family 10)